MLPIWRDSFLACFSVFFKSTTRIQREKYGNQRFSLQISTHVIANLFVGHHKVIEEKLKYIFRQRKTHYLFKWKAQCTKETTKVFNISFVRSYWYLIYFNIGYIIIIVLFLQTSYSIFRFYYFKYFNVTLLIWTFLLFSYGKIVLDSSPGVYLISQYDILEHESNFFWVFVGKISTNANQSVCEVFNDIWGSFLEEFRVFFPIAVAWV